jgi:hypothetical protein
VSTVLNSLLDDEGMRLDQLSQALGYPVLALRAHRAGGLVDIDRTTAIDIDLQLCHISELIYRMREAGCSNPAMWFEVTLVPGYTATGWTLYIESHLEALLHLALGVPAETVLDSAVPDWRTRYWSDYEVFPDADGHLSSRRKDGAL